MRNDSYSINFYKIGGDGPNRSSSDSSGGAGSNDENKQGRGGGACLREVIVVSVSGEAVNTNIR